MAFTTGSAASQRPLGRPDVESATCPDLGAPTWPRHVLVASSGSTSSAAALALAAALAQRSGASVELLAVFTPRIPAPVQVRPSDRHCESPDRVQAAQFLRAVRAQRDDVVRSGPVWPLRFESGDPAQVLTRVAREKKVDVAVLGIGRPDPRDRQRGDITPAIAANHTDTPLYVVAAGSDGPSRRTIVLLPEGHVHLPTIDAAIACTREGGDVWIAMPALLPDALRPADADSGMDGELLALRGAVARAEHVSMRTVELQGELLASVLSFADAVDAQLIAVPVCGSAGAVRSLLPNYAGPLLLTARCSILVVPDPA